MTGAVHPNRSKNLAMVDNMAGLVFSGDDNTVMRNWNTSNLRFQILPNILICSLSWRILWVPNPWSAGFRLDKRFVALLALRPLRRKLPFLSNSINFRVYCVYSEYFVHWNRNRQYMFYDVKLKLLAEIQRLYLQIDLRAEELNRWLIAVAMP